MGVDSRICPECGATVPVARRLRVTAPKVVKPLATQATVIASEQPAMLVLRAMFTSAEIAFCLFLFIVIAALAGG